ncbi:MAG: hypothetical protein K8S98_06165 [Planctomycetes bacterium]|nr:hypothetical protein [Planctomycetota bacterium]
MEIRSQPVGPNQPDRRIDITKPTREALKAGVEESVANKEDDPPVDQAALAKRIKNARADHAADALADRVKNAREEATQAAREQALQERIHNARVGHTEDVRAQEAAQKAKRIKNARAGHSDEVKLSFDPQQVDGARAERVQSLKDLRDAGKLHDEERLSRAAERLLSGDN